MDFRLVIVCWLALLAALASAAVASERPHLDLSGTWEFRRDPDDVGKTNRWFEANVPFERTIHVPGSWNAQGVEFPSADQLHRYEEAQLKEQQSLNRLGILGVQKESDRLHHVFPGPAWYRRRVTIPAAWAEQGLAPWLVFHGVHRNAEVWVNGKAAGVKRSYLTALRIDLSQPSIAARAGETITIVARVNARRDPSVDPLMGCLDTLDFLYVNWGGIHQPVTLEAVAPTRLEDVFIIPKPADSLAEIRLKIAGEAGTGMRVIAEIVEAAGTVAASGEAPVAHEHQETVLPVRIANPKPWAPRSPHLYTARVRLVQAGKTLDERAVRFGMREFQVAGKQFHLNHQPIFLRGYGDDCIFPETICPPADREALRARLTLARDHGFNFVRHHSWTPPEAYLDAADELGMMLQPEFPFAYRWDLPKTAEARQAALAEWEAVIRRNRNHPSIVSWCMGNELYDSFDLAPEMYRRARELDPTRPIIDSDGCRFEHKDRKTLDYLVVQFDEGRSIGHRDGKYDIPSDVSRPVLAHEMGYFVTLHDLSQVDRFKGGIRPYWLLQTQELARQRGVLANHPQWLDASYRLQAACLKSNIEAARRSGLAGTSIWLFQDYPNCAEGVVTMFGQPKSLSKQQFRRFNSPTVLLLDIPANTWWEGTTAPIRFVISRFEDPASQGATLSWVLKEGSEVLSQGEKTPLSIPSGGVQPLPGIELPLPIRSRAARWTLGARLTDAAGTIENEWNLWVFPRNQIPLPRSQVLTFGFDGIREMYPGVAEHEEGPIPPETSLLVTTRFNPEIHKYLASGGRVLLLDPEGVFPTEPTEFRLSSWDGGGPSGTILQADHPALRAFPNEGRCDLQFYSLIQGSKTVLLPALPSKLEPIIRCIDRPTRLADRAYLFEARTGQGKLLVSGLNFRQSLAAKDPAGLSLLDQLVRYALGPEFNPRTLLPDDVLKDRGKP